ncbi:uncharacterized protein RJT21DRAFT_12613 [Scheffersomyces amazonensis]|uniref:uncharacterized protein n=1 Tax=Scheffersomyces amazonensis TaxID=1078765 RepID=UPI00315D3F41
MNSDRPTLPRHTNNASVSSIGSSGNPQYLSTFKSNRSGSSGVRLGPTYTNAESFGYSTGGGETHSIRTIDRIPSAKPSVTYSDKLWTQIDVLDDVKTMAEQVRLKGSFFNDKFEGELNKLKESQNKLLTTMSMQNFDDMKTKETQKSLMKSQSTTIDNDDDDTAKQQKLNDFFREDDKGKATKELLNRKQNFDEMNQYVMHIREDLKEVAKAMKKFDETTRDQW